jgi:RNA polymerase sigma factor (sigma-70 family)
MKVDDDTLSRLAELSQLGDKAAYRQFLDICIAWLRPFFARRIAPCDVDDLVQDTLIAIHEKLGTYDANRPFLPWLAAIARYRWVDRLRKVYRAGEEMLGDMASDRIEQDAVMAQLSLDALFKLIPEAQATAIRLVKIRGMSISEASCETGQSEILVKVNIHRGLKKLATLVETG